MIELFAKLELLFGAMLFGLVVLSLLSVIRHWKIKKELARGFEVKAQTPMSQETK